MGRGSFSPREPVERPADRALRRANLRRVGRLFRPYRARLGAVLGLIAISATLGMASPFLLRDVLDHAIPDRDLALLSLLVGAMIAISVVTGVIGVAQTWLSNAVGQRVMHDLRAAVYRHLQRLSLAFFTRTRTGEVQSRIANDIGGVQNVVTSTATSVVSNMTTVLATVVAMFLLDWRLAAFSLALLPFFVLLSRRVGNQRRGITTDRQRKMADMSTLVEESLSVSGILLGKTMGRSAELADRFEAESSNLAELEVRQRMAGRWVMASIQMSFAIMPALVYWFAGWSYAAGGAAISIGTLVAFTTLQTRLFFPIGSLLSVGIDVQTSLALFDRVFEYLDLPVEIEERAGAVDLRRRGVQGHVELDGVWFRYGDEGEWTLEDVSVEVPAGTGLGVVGETGSGKTTLGYLVARLYDVERGRVRIDGIDVRDADFASLADTVGVVTQEPLLFSSSVADNIRYGRPGASDAEVEAAARAANAHEFIPRFPDGYRTLVGERGVQLSGGQKQRVAIARAVLKDARVLVLDEATSALDAESEHLVKEALDRLMKGRTTLIIAHRLSTVGGADRVIVIDKGHVVQSGDHASLIAEEGLYRRLVERQFAWGVAASPPAV